MSNPAERLAALSSEAASRVERAKRYRSKMDGLPANDPRRAECEEFVRDRLKASNSISVAVTAGVGSTIELTCSGRQAMEAMVALSALVEGKFGEE